MNWKITAVATSATALVGWLASTPPRTSAVQENSSRALAAGSAISEMEKQAAGLRTRLRSESEFRAPTRNPFQFGERPRAGRPAEPAPVLPADPPAEPTPPPVPFKLTGMATDIVDGATARIAILSSFQGITLAREGETLELGYRVIAIGEEQVELESIGDGSRVTLRLPSFSVQ